MRRALVFSLLCAVLLLPGSGTPAGAAFPGANGRIAFYVYNVYPQAISTMAFDGSDRTRLLEDRHAQFEPAWSADGSRILFGRYGGARDAFVSVAADGSDLQVIATERQLPRGFGEPTWAPSGTQIAFCAEGRDHLFKVFVIGTDGTGLQNISGAGNDDCYPSWSPDGSRIAAVSGVTTGSSDIITMDPDGGNRTTIVQAGDNGWPDWSPDGSMLAFTRKVQRVAELFVAAADGGSVTRLTTTRGFEYTPAWAPDGSAIVYCRTRTADPFSPCDLFTIAPDGSGLTRLTGTARRDEFKPSWQPLAP
jgi:TolB protein